jgi:hypothetical protein
VHVAARHPEVRRAGFDETGRRAEILDLAGIRRRRDQRWESTVGIGSVDVSKQGGAVPSFDTDVDLVPDAVLGLAQIAVVAAGGLRTIEPALTRLAARGSGYIDLSDRGCSRNLLMSWLIRPIRERRRP